MKKLLLMIMALFVLASCGAYRETVQVNDKAYLL
jgi:uncharacterized protein YcfL